MSRTIFPSNVDGITRLDYAGIGSVGVPVEEAPKGVRPLELSEGEVISGFVQIDKYGEPVRHLTSTIQTRDVSLGCAGDPLEIDWPDESEFTSIMEDDEPDEWEWPDEEDYVDGPEDEEPPGES